MHIVIKYNKEKIAALCEQYHIKKLYAFGSIVTEEFENDGGYIDLLYEPDYTGFDFKDMKNAPYDVFTTFFDFKEALEKLFTKEVKLIHNQPFRNKYLLQEIEETKQLLFSKEDNLVGEFLSQ